MRGVTADMSVADEYMDISTHTPHARRDLLRRWNTVTATAFQLTRLMRGVTIVQGII